MPRTKLTDAERVRRAREARKRWRDANPEKVKAYSMSPQARESRRAWKTRNPDKVAAARATAVAREYRRNYGRVLRPPRGLSRLAAALRSFDRLARFDVLHAESVREAAADHVEWLETLDAVELE